jgi:hypothetical protein
MMKMLLIFLVTLLMSGCSYFDKKPANVYKQKKVDINNQETSCMLARSSVNNPDLPCPIKDKKIKRFGVK